MLERAVRAREEEAKEGFVGGKEDKLVVANMQEVLERSKELLIKNGGVHQSCYFFSENKSPELGEFPRVGGSDERAMKDLVGLVINDRARRLCCNYICLVQDTWVALEKPNEPAQRAEALMVNAYGPFVRVGLALEYQRTPSGFKFNEPKLMGGVIPAWVDPWWDDDGEEKRFREKLRKQAEAKQQRDWPWWKKMGIVAFKVNAFLSGMSGKEEEE